MRDGHKARIMIAHLFIKIMIEWCLFSSSSNIGEQWKRLVVRQAQIVQINWGVIISLLLTIHFFWKTKSKRICAYASCEPCTLCHIMRSRYIGDYIQRRTVRNWCILRLIISRHCSERWPEVLRSRRRINWVIFINWPYKYRHHCQINGSITKGDHSLLLVISTTHIMINNLHISQR